MLLKRRTHYELFFLTACFKGLVGSFHRVFFFFFFVFIQEMHNDEQEKKQVSLPPPHCILLNVCTLKGTHCDNIQLWRIHIALWLSVQMNEKWPL